MPAPPDLQSAFMDAVLGDPEVGIDAGLEAAISTDGLSLTEKLAIHRENAFRTITNSLGSVFPVVRKLVGEEFFVATAREYIRLRPPRSGSLLFFGHDFGDFLDNFPTVSKLPYLGDMARLEWFWHEAFHAADAAPINPYDLKEVAEERLGDMQITLHPSARLLISDYPIDAIWQANQYDPDCTEVPEIIDLTQGGCRLLIIRPVLDVEVRVLKPGVYAMLAALMDGSDLNRSHAAATAVYEQFDFEGAMVDLIEGGTFVACSCS